MIFVIKSDFYNIEIKIKADKRGLFYFIFFSNVVVVLCSTTNNNNNPEMNAKSGHAYCQDRQFQGR